MSLTPGYTCPCFVALPVQGGKTPPPYWNQNRPPPCSSLVTLSRVFSKKIKVIGCSPHGSGPGCDRVRAFSVTPCPAPQAAPRYSQVTCTVSGGPGKQRPSRGPSPRCGEESLPCMADCWAQSALPSQLSVPAQPFIHKSFREIWCWFIPKWMSSCDCLLLAWVDYCILIFNLTKSTFQKNQKTAVWG